MGVGDSDIRNIEVTDCTVVSEFLAVKWEQIYNSEHAVPHRNLNVREASCNSGCFNPAPISGNSITELRDDQFWEEMSFTPSVRLL